jgi:hypothetical protein
MMGGQAFILLKDRVLAVQCPKQAEGHLTILLKMLWRRCLRSVELFSAEYD